MVVIGACAAVELWGRDPCGPSVGEFRCLPAISGQLVIGLAGKGEFVDVGWAAGRPLVGVVHFAPVAGHVAAGVGAAAVLRVEDQPLIGRG